MTIMAVKEDDQKVIKEQEEQEKQEKQEKHLNNNYNTVSLFIICKA